MFVLHARIYAELFCKIAVERLRKVLWMMFGGGAFSPIRCDISVSAVCTAGQVSETTTDIPAGDLDELIDAKFKDQALVAENMGSLLRKLSIVSKKR